jgi:hypothetical protein
MCMCQPTITHGPDIVIVSDGWAVAPPTGARQLTISAICMWLLAFEAAAARSARVPPHALLAVEVAAACSTRVPPRTLCQRFGPAHDHVGGPICMRLHRTHHHGAVTCGTMELRAAKTAI